MRREPPKPKTPAPAFAAWAKQQEELEFTRGREALAQFAAVRSEVGELGYLLTRDEHTDRYLLYVAESSVPHPTKPADMHFTRYVVEFDVHKQVVRVTRRATAAAPPVAILAKPWTLETAVHAYVKVIKERGDAPNLPEPETDESDGE